MSIDQKWIGNISGNYRELINIYVVDIINKSNSSALSSICWLDNPDILLAIMLLQLLIMLIKFSKLVWQNIGIWHEIEMLFSKPFLHPHTVEAESILSRDLMTLREMVDLLILIKSLVKVALAGG